MLPDFTLQLTFVDNGSRANKVKSLSPHDRFVIALHSPNGVFEPGLLGDAQPCNENSTTEPLSLADRIEKIGRALTANELAEMLTVSKITIFKQAKAGLNLRRAEAASKGQFLATVPVVLDVRLQGESIVFHGEIRSDWVRTMIAVLGHQLFCVLIVLVVACGWQWAMAQAAASDTMTNRT